MNRMLSETTEGVKISVEVFYQTKSRPTQNEYIFAYRITIENQSDYTIQLLKRHWRIFDSNGLVRLVDGDGVIGKQPVLTPEESHQYISACYLSTDIGQMSGYYLMERQIDGHHFQVKVPAFNLFAPPRLN